MKYKLSKAEKIAQEVLINLTPHCQKIEILGSIRRRKLEVKDIEILCIPKTRAGTKIRTSGWINSTYASAGCMPTNMLKGRLKDGKHIQFRTMMGIRVDLFVANPDNWAVLKLIRTGPADFSKKAMVKLNQMGFTSKDGIIQDKETGEQIILETEMQVFEFLGIKYLEPESRL